MKTTFDKLDVGDKFKMDISGNVVNTLVSNELGAMCKVKYLYYRNNELNAMDIDVEVEKVG